MLKRIAGPFKDFGPAAGLLYVVDRALGAVSPRLRLHYYELMRQPVLGEAVLPDRLARNLRWQVLPPGHADLAQVEVRPGVLDRRFAQGAQCLGVYRRDELLGYAWTCADQYREDEMRCDFVLPDRVATVFDFDVRVLPEHRMGIGFAALWHALLAHLHARGVHASYSRITRFNLASRRAHQRIGAVRVGRLWALCLGPLELVLTSAPPRLAVSRRDAHRVRVLLSG